MGCLHDSPYEGGVIRRDHHNQTRQEVTRRSGDVHDASGLHNIQKLGALALVAVLGVGYIVIALVALVAVLSLHGPPGGDDDDGAAVAVRALHLVVDTRVPLRWWQAVVKQTTAGPLAITTMVWADQVIHVVAIAVWVAFVAR